MSENYPAAVAERPEIAELAAIDWRENDDEKVAQAAELMLEDIETNYGPARDFLSDLREIGADHGNQPYDRLEELLDQIDPGSLEDAVNALSARICTL